MSTHSQSGPSVGARIRAARLAMKFTQSQLARPDFSVSYISAIERGQIQPSLRALTILAARLGLSSTQLLTGQPSDETPPGPSLNKPTYEDEIELALVEAQIATQQGAALQALEQLQHVVPKNLKQRQLRQYLLGWAYLQAGQFEESKDALLEAARLANDSHMNLHILNLLGAVYMATHNHTEAFAAYQRCLDRLASDQQWTPFFTMQVYTNLGEYYIRLNQFGQAVKMFQRAAAITNDLATSKQRILMYGTASQRYIATGEYHLAMLNLHKCLHLYNHESLLRARSTLYHQLCRAAMQGDAEKARTYLDAALRREKDGQDRLSVASITTHLATWFLTQHALAEAQEYAQQAYAEAQPFGDTLIAAEAALLLGRIAYAQSQYETGDGYFAIGLAMLERLGLREDWAEGSVLYAQLLEDSDRPEEALKYWKRAFEGRYE